MTSSRESDNIVYQINMSDADFPGKTDMFEAQMEDPLLSRVIVSLKGESNDMEKDVVE